MFEMLERVTFERLHDFEVRTGKYKTAPVLPPNEYTTHGCKINKDFILDIVWGYTKTLITSKYTEVVKKDIDSQWGKLETFVKDVFKLHASMYETTGKKLYRYVMMCSLCRYTSQHARNWLTKFREELRVLGQDIKETKNLFLRVFYPSNWVLYCEPIMVYRTKELGHNKYKFAINKLMDLVKNLAPKQRQKGNTDVLYDIKGLLSTFNINANFLHFLGDINLKENVAQFTEHISHQGKKSINEIFLRLHWYLYDDFEKFPLYKEFIDNLHLHWFNGELPIADIRPYLMTE